ncbi:MAG: helix-turn-helix domain-containing protein [Chloroflexi bacterium]|nr:helix-turn-helix domain-containing protein [Chloroflexota bacterium]
MKQPGKRLTVKAIADYCLVSRVTIRRWIRDGKLAAIRLPSGHYRVSLEDFRDFLKRYDIPIKEELSRSESEKKGGDK